METTIAINILLYCWIHYLSHQNNGLCDFIIYNQHKWSVKDDPMGFGQVYGCVRSPSVLSLGLIHHQLNFMQSLG